MGSLIGSILVGVVVASLPIQADAESNLLECHILRSYGEHVESVAGNLLDEMDSAELDLYRLPEEHPLVIAMTELEALALYNRDEHWAVESMRHHVHDKCRTD